ncbi:MAG: hypothetical protein MJZ32_07955 [Bacteroidaceae bacterium]|nr:hypothetical protein [Bacteroidaceae bacterium]
MKKIIVMTMAMLAMAFAFTSCGDDDEESADKFKSCVFKAEPSFSNDMMNLYDITVTYTAMDGSVKVITPQNGTFPILDEGTQLPATVKLEIKAVKKPTFDEYMNSKDEFNIMINSPLAYASYKTVGSESKGLWSDKYEGYYVGVSREEALVCLKNLEPHMNITIEGTFTKSGSGCTFVKK